MRWTSSGRLAIRLIARTTGGPMEMFGTKCPSITSTWIKSAPPRSTAAMSRPSAAKSADRMDGAICTVGARPMTGCGPIARASVCGAGRLEAMTSVAGAVLGFGAYEHQPAVDVPLEDLPLGGRRAGVAPAHGRHTPPHDSQWIAWRDTTGRLDFLD